MINGSPTRTSWRTKQKISCWKLPWVILLSLHRSYWAVFVSSLNIIRRLLNFICIVTLRYSIPFSGYMNLCRKCIQFLLIKSCGSSWWELYKVIFVRETIFAVVVTSHPNIVQFRFLIILPASNHGLTQLGLYSHYWDRAKRSRRGSRICTGHA